jgi:hypothetical protein
LADENQELAMNPIIHQELITARIAELHRQAARGRMARAATQARSARTDNGSAPAPAPARTVTVLARLVITVLGARSPQQESQ